MHLKSNLIKNLNFLAIFTLLLASTAVLVLPTQANHAGDALRFDGLDDFVQLDRTSDLMGGAGWIAEKTISVWVKPGLDPAPDTTPAEGEIIVGNDRPRTFGITRAIFNGEDHIWVWNVDSDGLDTIGVEYTPGEWTQISMVHAEGILSVYKDARLVGSTSSGDTFLPSPNADGTSFLGGNARSDSSASFQGDIDEVRFWNVGLPADQLLNWLVKELDLSHPSYGQLAAYYRMSDGSGTSLTDDSGSGHTGALNGGGMGDGNWVASGALHDDTLIPTESPAPSMTPTPTMDLPTETSTPDPTSTNTSAVDTATPTPDVPVDTPTWTPEPTSTNTPTDSPPTATFTPTPTSLPPTATFTLTPEPPTATNTNTPTATATLDNGAAGYALAFDGSTDYVILDETDNIFDTGWQSTKSVSFWVRPDSWAGSCGVSTPAWCPSIFGDRPRWWGVSIGEVVGLDRIWVWNYDGSSGSPTEIIPIDYTPDEWVHVALVHGAGELKAYRNGILVGALPNGSTIQPNTGAHPVLHLGGIIINSSRNWTFDGAIDELRLWSLARSQAEIQADMNRTLTGSESGLSAYYQMSDGTGITLTDDSQNGWNGTLNDGNGNVVPDGTYPAWISSGAPIGIAQPTSTPSAPTETPTSEPATSTWTPTPAADTATPEPDTPTPEPPTATSAPPTLTPTATATIDPSTATPTPTAGPGLQQVSSVDTPGYSYDLALLGNTLYVADTSGGLQVIDITDAFNPVTIGSLSTPRRAYGVAVEPGVAYVAATQAGVLVIDISDPSQPELITTFDGTSYAWHVELMGSYAFVADRLDGLHILDVQDPAQPQLVTTLPTSDQSLDIDFYGQYAYLADYRAGVKVLDVSDPSNPQVLQTLATNQTYGLTVQDDMLFVADGNSGLKIYDLANPEDPALLGEYPSDGSMRSVVVQGQIAYVADWMLGLFAIDVSNPASPALLYSVDTTGRAVDVLNTGAFTYLADYEGSISVFTGP